jgi:Ser/Thr protein kinase RdoA (MazF antagonist)
VDEVREWPGLQLHHQVEEGNRNEVWAGVLDGRPVSVRRSRRSPASLAWELDLLRVLDSRGFHVPLPIATANGEWSHRGVVVQQWMHGSPPSSARDWQLVATELQRLHATCDDIVQRPGCLTVTELDPTSRSVDACLSDLPAEVTTLVLGVFDSLADVPISLIHGDPGPSNIRIDDIGQVGLLDWDESRVDLTWHDLSNLGVKVLDTESHARATQLSHAWEAINAWMTEPDYARERLAHLLK